MNIYVLTLVSAENTFLDTKIIANAQHSLQTIASVKILDTNSLSKKDSSEDPKKDHTKERAVDILFSIDEDNIQELSSVNLEKTLVDYCIQPFKGRFKKLLVTDMDKTVIDNETIVEMITAMGQGEKAQALMNQAKNNEITYMKGIKARSKLLTGTKATPLFKQQLATIKYISGAKTLIATHRYLGGIPFLLTAGVEEFAQKVVKELGYSGHYSNFLSRDVEDKFDGYVDGPVLSSEQKAMLLGVLCKEQDIELENSCAIGDGINDIGMIDGAGLGVSYKSPDNVRQYANAEINVGNLETLLFFMGIVEDNFIHDIDELKEKRNTQN